MNRNQRMCSRVLPAIALGIAASTLVTTAHADNRFYVGMDAMNWFLDEDQGENFSSLGVRGKLGLRLAPQFSLEAHLGGTGSDRSRGERRELDLIYGGLARGELPVTRYTSLYGVFGITAVEVTGRDPDGARISERDTGLSLGIGADFNVTHGTYLNIDYIRYINGSDFDFHAISAGARWSF